MNNTQYVQLKLLECLNPRAWWKSSNSRIFFMNASDVNHTVFCIDMLNKFRIGFILTGIHIGLSVTEYSGPSLPLSPEFSSNHSGAGSTLPLAWIILACLEWSRMLPTALRLCPWQFKAYPLRAPLSGQGRIMALYIGTHGINCRNRWDYASGQSDFSNRNIHCDKTRDQKHLLPDNVMELSGDRLI